MITAVRTEGERVAGGGEASRTGRKDRIAMPTEEEIIAAQAAALAEAQAWAAAARAGARNRPDARTNTQSAVMTTFHFYVQISGITEAVFTQVEGLDAETKVDY